jgi:hypothetical protein
MTPNARIAFLLPVPGQLHLALVKTENNALTDVYRTMMITAVFMCTRQEESTSSTAHLSFMSCCKVQLPCQ